MVSDLFSFIKGIQIQFWKVGHYDLVIVQLT